MLLTLDVGVTTGYALFWENGVSEESGDLPLMILHSALVNLKLKWDVTECVVEMPVIMRGPLGDELTEAVETVSRAFPEAHKIQPADWKQHPLSRAYVRRNTSQHEKDALRIGIWWLNK